MMSLVWLEQAVRWTDGFKLLVFTSTFSQDSSVDANIKVLKAWECNVMTTSGLFFSLQIKHSNISVKVEMTFSRKG